MNSEPTDPLEQLRSDWQQTQTPAVSVDAVKRGLRWRWLLLALDVSALFVGAGVLFWAASRIAGVLEWVYWSFFALALFVSMIVTAFGRLGSLWRENDSAVAILEQARRHARLRLRIGRLGFWLSVSIGGFVFIWLILKAWLERVSATDFFNQHIGSIAFAVVWCSLGAIVGVLERRRAERRISALRLLERELQD